LAPKAFQYICFSHLVPKAAAALTPPSPCHIFRARIYQRRGGSWI
jgi:hypothetical protein